MLADLDLLLTSVFCTADDLLPKKPGNARRSLTDAEVVTLCVAQSIMGISSDARFIKIAIKQLGHLFPALTKRSGFHKRRDRLTDTIEALITTFAAPEPRLARRPAARRLHSGGVRALARDGQARRIEQPRRRHCRRRRLRLLRQPQPLLLGAAAAHADGARRDPASDGADLSQGRRARGLPAAAGARSTAAAPSRSSATRAMPAPTSRPTLLPLAPPIVRPRRKDERGDGPAPRPHCASGSSRSTGPQRTSSLWSATAPAPCAASGPASPAASWRSRPRSR